jgi:hypothetical protein
MSICIDACAAQERIVVATCSTVYELVVLQPDRADVLVRGGRYFTEFRRALCLGSISKDGSLERHTIDIGLRMTFAVGEKFIITSPVRRIQGTVPHSFGESAPEEALAL